MHPSQKKIQNTHSGQVRDSWNTCILYTLPVDHPLAVFLTWDVGPAVKPVAVMKTMDVCPIHPTVSAAQHLCPATMFVITADVAATVPLD